MTFERTRDMELVGAIVRHPQIYSYVVDDFAPPREQFQPVDHPNIWYVLVMDEGKVIGLFAFHAHSQVMWEVHTCLLPSAWGKRGRRAAREVAEWVWANTPCRRIITSVPSFNRLALRFAQAAGMSQYGDNPKSFQKNGVLHSQIMLGLSRPEEN